MAAVQPPQVISIREQAHSVGQRWLARAIFKLRVSGAFLRTAQGKRPCRSHVSAAELLVAEDEFGDLGNQDDSSLGHEMQDRLVT